MNNNYNTLIALGGVGFITGTVVLTVSTVITVLSKVIIVGGIVSIGMGVYKFCNRDSYACKAS